MFKKTDIFFHFKELKNRIIKLLIIFIFFLFISFYFLDDIFSIIVMPLVKMSNDNGRNIIFTSLTEAFMARINLAFFASFLAIIPFIAYHIYKFISPGLYEYEKKLAKYVIISAPSLFFAGVVFVYYFVMPKAFEFFLTYEYSTNLYNISLEAKISEYISLVTSLIIAFGIAFQLPVIIIILVLMRLLNSATLKSSRRIGIIIIFTISGIITPPDVLSQLALAFPLILMYEITIFISKKIENRRKKNA